MSGSCEGCADIMNTDGVDTNLRSWFAVLCRVNIMICIVAAPLECERDQEIAFKEGKSRAHFGVDLVIFQP